ncbi:MAG: hypothetical protein JOZ27_07185, partial [Caulobacteraceae bacterium]|nr:hypothetical protein [Caulobacteraceae bacterium]
MLIVVLYCAGALYRHAVERRNAPRLTTILLGCAAALALAALAPLLFSSDIYAYAAYGEMARIGLDPYVRAPIHSTDVLIRAAQAQWGTNFPICVYGPAFVALARAIVTVLSPFGVAAVLDGFRATAAVALLLCIVLAYDAYTGDAAARLRAAATIGLNPVAIWCAAEGHNDALALAIVLAGFLLARRRLVQLGAAIAALSALVKLPGLVAALGLAAANARARIGAFVGVAIAAALSLPLMMGVATQLAPHGRYAPQACAQ